MPAVLIPHFLRFGYGLKQTTPGQFNCRDFLNEHPFVFRVEDSRSLARTAWRHGDGIVATKYRNYTTGDLNTLCSEHMGHDQLVRYAQELVGVWKNGTYGPNIFISTSLSLPYALWEAARRQSRPQVDVYITVIDSRNIESNVWLAHELIPSSGNTDSLKRFSVGFQEVLFQAYIPENAVVARLPWQTLLHHLPGWVDQNLTDPLNISSAYRTLNSYVMALEESAYDLREDTPQSFNAPERSSALVKDAVSKAFAVLHGSRTKAIGADSLAELDHHVGRIVEYAIILHSWVTWASSRSYCGREAIQDEVKDRLGYSTLSLSIQIRLLESKIFRLRNVDTAK